MHDLVRDITFCIVAAWLLGLVAQSFRQPVLLAYLAGGFLLGPSGLKWIQSAETISTISELGLIFLLFMIGLEIDLKKIVSAGSSITITALAQIGGSVVLGVLFFKLLGFGTSPGHWDALYLAVAAALSSTVIVVKGLYEKRELDTLPGRITLGVLVLQDLAAILFLAIRPNLEHLGPGVLLGSAARTIALVTTAMVISRFVLPQIFRHVSRLPELVQVGALAWCFLMGELGEQLHLSREMGALVAGVSLSTFPYALDVTARVTSLRDFFITLFFVGLGLAIPFPTWHLLGWALIFAAFTVVCCMLTTFTPLFWMRQGLRTSFLPALNLAQVSEFSLVVLALGAQSSHLRRPETSSGMVSLAFVLLAAVSSFGISHSHAITQTAVRLLKRLGVRDLDHAQDGEHGTEGHASSRIVFLGFFRTASSLLEEVQRQAPELLPEMAVVDFSPMAREGLLQRGVRVIYGDIAQRETLLHAGIEKAEVVLSTIPDALLKGTSNEKLVKLVRGLNPRAQIIATADVLQQAHRLMEVGADYVSVARLDEATDLLGAIQSAFAGGLQTKRAGLETALQDRHEVLA